MPRWLFKTALCVCRSCIRFRVLQSTRCFPRLFEAATSSAHLPTPTNYAARDRSKSLETSLNDYCRGNFLLTPIHSTLIKTITVGEHYFCSPRPDTCVIVIGPFIACDIASSHHRLCQTVRAAILLLWNLMIQFFLVRAIHPYLIVPGFCGYYLRGKWFTFVWAKRIRT